MTPKLPPPKHLRRQQRRDGGYDMVPAYTAEEMQAYGLACWKQGMERAAEICERRAETYGRDVIVNARNVHRRIAAAILNEITP